MMKVWHGGVAVASLPELQARLFAGRGLSVRAAESFLALDYQRDIHDPYLLHDMPQAVERIRTAIKKGERILIYGDYDADGICATAILVSTLRNLGAEVIPYLPHRLDDGYGLSLLALKNLLSEFDLCLTVDCGISNSAEIAWMRDQKKDVIIVDHHEIPEVLPPALAILHPRHQAGAYPYPWLCGAGVTWKLASALLANGQEKWLLDLAALGTLADVVPLVGENRAIARFGLEIIRRTRRPGLKALLAISRLTASDLTAKDVTWRVIPYLNAAGRMDHPQPALDLLLATDERQAAALATQLQQYNQDRQAVTKRVLREAQAHVMPTDAFIFAHNTAWPAGVVGLAAGRLADQFSCPAIVIGSNGRHAVGSARAPAGHNVLNLLESGRSQMLKLGGHAQAAGFSVAVDKIGHLQEVLRKFSSEQVPTPPGEPHVQAEAILNSSLLNRRTVDLLAEFEPFGEGNPKPTFISRKLKLVETRLVGKKQEHLKCVFSGDDGFVDGIGFSLGSTAATLKSHVDVLFHLESNEFNGRSTVQLVIIDIMPAGQVEIITA